MTQKRHKKNDGAKKSTSLELAHETRQLNQIALGRRMINSMSIAFGIVQQKIQLKSFQQHFSYIVKSFSKRIK